MARTKSGHSPAVVAAAIALPFALMVGVLVMAVLAQRGPVSAPVALPGGSAPDAANPACSSLVAALPTSLAGADRAPLTQPAPAGALAWRNPATGGEAVVLRCGIPRPAEFTKAAALIGVNGVQWLELPVPAQGVAATTYVAVDRAAYLALTLPLGSGTGALQQVSDVVAATLPAHDLDPAPIGG